MSGVPLDEQIAWMAMHCDHTAGLGHEPIYSNREVKEAILATLKSLAKSKADATYACSVCEWGGELPQFVSTTDNSYRVTCPKCGEQAEINPPVWP